MVRLVLPRAWVRALSGAATGWVLVAIAIATVGIVGSPAHAAAAPDPAPTTVVLLRAPGDATDVNAAIADHTKSVGLTVVQSAPSADPPLPRALKAAADPSTLGVFWLQQRPSGLSIYLYEPQAQGVFVRELARAADESDAALVESVGLIVASTAAALAGGQEVGMRPLDAAEIAELKPEPKTEPKPEPQSPPPGRTREPPPRPVEDDDPPPSRVPLRIAAAYLGDGFNRDAPWQSGARIAFGVAPHRLLRIALGYGFVGPSTAASAPSLRLVRHEIGLSLGVGGDVGDRVTLHGTALATLDLAQWRADGRRGLRPIGRIGPMFEFGVRLVAGLFFDVGVGAQVSLNRFDFVVCATPDGACSGADREVIASGWRVAPRATAGLSYRF